MMIVICVALSLIYLLVNVASVAIRNYRAHQFFKTKSPDLPVIPDPNLFTGHLMQVIRTDKNCLIISDLHKVYGPTFGFYYCHHPWVATKDLDLLKLIEVDEAHKHTNRCHLEMPFEEFNNSIFQTNDEVWRRARRAVGPALTYVYLPYEPNLAHELSI